MPQLIQTLERGMIVDQVHVRYSHDYVLQESYKHKKYLQKQLSQLFQSSMYPKRFGLSKTKRGTSVLFSIRV